MKPLSIYIHIPFCEKKCAYCDFVSFDNKASEIDKYVDALCNEIKSAGIKVAETVFIGGGTPSLLTNDQLSEIFKNLPEADEITIEANPNSITIEKLQHWRTLGINRISIGVQSFDDTVLRTLGRIHTSEQAVSAVKLAYKCGFRNISIDLIHSVTNAAIKIPTEIFKYITHVSAYCLIIEAGKHFKPIPEQHSIRQQKQIELILGINGFEKYEVSNFARPGFECRHNLAYWQPQTHEYIGFGLAAHSFLGGRRFSNTSDFNKYLSGSFQDSFPAVRNEDLLTETIMLGLRTTRGVAVEFLKHKLAEIQFLESLKLIKRTGGCISATPKGFFVLNAIIEKLT